MRLKNEASTDTRFTRRWTARGRRKTSLPKTSAVPPSGSSSVESNRTSVDLPEPFGPRMATHSPRSISKSRPLSAATRRLPRLSRRVNSLRRLWTSRAFMVAPTRRDADSAHSPEAGGARGNRSQPRSNIARRGYLRPRTRASGRLQVGEAPADKGPRAAMTYDETWDAGPSRRLPLAAIAVLLAVVALGA